MASEDVVYMLHGLDYFTGVNLDQLVDAGDYITKSLNRPNRSRAASALLAQRQEQNKA